MEFDFDTDGAIFGAIARDDLEHTRDYAGHHFTYRPGRDVDELPSVYFAIAGREYLVTVDDVTGQHDAFVPREVITSRSHPGKIRKHVAAEPDQR